MLIIEISQKASRPHAARVFETHELVRVGVQTN